MNSPMINWDKQAKLKLMVGGYLYTAMYEQVLKDINVNSELIKLAVSQQDYEQFDTSVAALMYTATLLGAQDLFQAIVALRASVRDDFPTTDDSLLRRWREETQKVIFALNKVLCEQ